MTRRAFGAVSLGKTRNICIPYRRRTDILLPLIGVTTDIQFECSRFSLSRHALPIGSLYHAISPGRVSQVLCWHSDCPATQGFRLGYRASIWNSLPFGFSRGNPVVREIVNARLQISWSLCPLVSHSKSTSAGPFNTTGSLARLDVFCAVLVRVVHARLRNRCENYPVRCQRLLLPALLDLDQCTSLAEYT